MFFCNHIACGQFKRNERLKSKFQCSTKLGTIECDMLNGIIKIKNAYHSIREIKSCTFYAGEPRFSGLWRRDIYENVWFTYQLRNGIRPKEQKIQTAICHFRTDSQNYYIEPPVCVTVYKQIINGMVEDMQRKLRLLGAATITEEILDDSKDNVTGNTNDEL